MLAQLDLLWYFMMSKAYQNVVCTLTAVNSNFFIRRWHALQLVRRSSLISPRTGFNRVCIRKESCVQVGPYTCCCDFDVPCDCKQGSYFLFTSKAGSTDHFHWFMDHIVGLFTSSLDSNSEKLRSLNTFSLWASWRANYSNMAVYVGVTIFALCFLSEC